MYTVIGSRRSRAFRVLWMLEELGAAYDHVPAGPRSEEARAANPAGKIPALRDGDAVLTDSAAILAYLGDKHAALTHPAGTVARARQDAMIHAVLDEMDALLWTAARHSFILPEDRRVPAVKDSLRWEFSANLATMAARMGDAPFAAGDIFTTADILLTHCLGWAGNAKFDITEPALADYAERMRARPAYARADAKP